MPQRYVFISYVRESRRVAQKLANDLKQRSVEVWIDYERLLPGDRWKEAVHQAIRSGSLFLALFTPEYAFKDSAFMNEELRFAIDELRQRPADRRWFVPAVVSGTMVPNLRISANETLRDLHWLDLSDDWDVAVDVIARMVFGVERDRGDWRELSAEVAALSPTDREEALQRGAIPVPSYVFEEAMFAVARASRRSVQTVSYDDLALWCAAEPRSRRYQAEKSSGLMRGLAMSRVLVIHSLRLRHSAAQVQELLADHLFRRIGLAIVISEDVPEDGRHTGQDFAIFDAGGTVSIGGRDAPWLLVAFETHDAIPATDRMAQRQVWLYDWLIDHAVLATDEFTRQHPRVAERAASAAETVTTLTADDDVEERIEALNDSRA